MEANKLEFTLRDVLIIASILISASIQWGTLHATLSGMQEDIAQLRLDMREIRTSLILNDSSALPRNDSQVKGVLRNDLLTSGVGGR